MQTNHISSRLPLPRPFLGFLSNPPKHCPLSSSSPIPSPNPRISCKFSNNNNNNNSKIKIQSKKKDNVWSIDNDLAAKELAIDTKKKKTKEFSVRGRKKRGKGNGRKKRNGLVLASAAMLMEVETVLQTQDGSYSRGPVEMTVGEPDKSQHILSPTFKFEQCLVKGCHKRLRIVHTIEFSEGGSDIQITRVAVYEEQWVSPVNLYEGVESQADPEPISLRRRIQPSELAGSWKVFEMSATPIFDEESTVVEEGSGPPYVYLCMETLKRRSLPESSTYFVEEETLDVNDVTVLWLPGGVTGYVDVKEDGILCIGVGWYSDEGINLVMERDYGMDGKLKEVRSKTEVKRRWTEPVSP